MQQILNANQFCHSENKRTKTISLSAPHAEIGCFSPLHRRNFTLFFVRKTPPKPLPKASLNALKYYDSHEITATTVPIQHENLAAKSKRKTGSSLSTIRIQPTFLSSAWHSQPVFEVAPVPLESPCPKPCGCIEINVYSLQPPQTPCRLNMVITQRKAKINATSPCAI